MTLYPQKYDITTRTVTGLNNAVQPSDVVLNCDTSLAPVSINLADFTDNLWNTQYKLYINDASSLAGTNNITINAPVGYTIGNASSIVISSNGGSVIISISSNKKYSSLFNFSTPNPAIIVKNEGSVITTGVTSFNFVGAWINAVAVGSLVTVTVSPTPISVTSVQLNVLISTSTLVAGATYRLTDYKNVNFLNGFVIANSNPVPVNVNFIPKQIYTHTEEVLVLTAETTSQLSPIVFSEKYPQDIITFQPYTSKIGVDISYFNGDTHGTVGLDLQWDGVNVFFDMPLGTNIHFGNTLQVRCNFSSGATQNIRYEPISPYVVPCSIGVSNLLPNAEIQVKNYQKVVLIGLTNADFLLYTPNSLIVNHILPLGDAYGYISSREDTLNSIRTPFDFRGRRYRRFEVNMTALNPALATGYFGIGDNYRGQGTTGNFKDSPVFPLNNTLSMNWDGFSWISSIATDNNVFSGTEVKDNNFTDINVYGNTFTGVVSKNNMGDYFYNNVGITFSSNVNDSIFYDNIISDFSENIAPYNFHGNILGSCISNNFGSEFNTNTIAIAVGKICSSNVFLAQTYQNVFNGTVQHNKFGLFFQNNTIGDNTQDCIVGNHFHHNTIGANFKNNILGDNSNNNIIDASFSENVIATSFNRNTIQIGFQGNSINVGFEDNNIGSNFNDNNIGMWFNTCTIGSGFNSNTTQGVFSNNTVGTTCENNVFGASFDGNVIGNNFKQNLICPILQAKNFSLSTHVYANYTKRIFKSSDGNFYIEYLNGAVSTIVLATS